MMLELRHVSISLRERILLEINASVAAGEILTVMGPSGAGKSTLLAFVAGFLDKAFRATGEVWLNGRELTPLAPEARGVGLLFQDDLLFPHLTVAGNLAFGLRAKANRAERIEAALAEAGLGGMGGRDPASLSGGQRARVSLLRVLLSEPGALLLDEPFSRLDKDLRGKFREFVFAQARGLPVLMVSHDEEDAQAAGGRIFRLA
jgi:putative thiamine transport system ATP-binding protein